MGNEEDIIWFNLCNGIKGKLNSRLEYSSHLNKKVIRRINRFSNISASAAASCYKKMEDRIGNVDKNRVGCIFTTGFGPLETNLEFAKQIIQDDPDACSPILFSNTVHNACLGTISIDLGITGPSTMLLGSNHLMMSEMLLDEDKADMILAGCVEEYNEELKKSLQYQGCASQEFGEAVVVLGLTKNSSAQSPVRISRISTYHLGYNPYEDNEVNRNIILRAITAEVKPYEVDAIIQNDILLMLGNAEKDIIIDECLSAAIIDRFYLYFGNCLGADMGLKVLISKLILEKNELPACLCSGESIKKNISKIAVLSADLTGNYTIVILER